MHLFVFLVVTALIILTIFYPLLKVKRIIEERYYDIHQKYKPISVIDFIKYEEDRIKFIKLLVEIRNNQDIKENDMELHKTAALAESLYISCPDTATWKIILFVSVLICINALVGAILY